MKSESSENKTWVVSIFLKRSIDNGMCKVYSNIKMRTFPIYKIDKKMGGNQFLIFLFKNENVPKKFHKPVIYSGNEKKMNV